MSDTAKKQQAEVFVSVRDDGTLYDCAVRRIDIGRHDYSQAGKGRPCRIVKGTLKFEAAPRGKAKRAAPTPAPATKPKK